MNRIIDNVVSKYLEGKDKIATIEGLYGDASYRRYFRVELESGNSLIVMKMPEGASSISEEITNYEGTINELPYINIAKHLKKAGLPVPKVLSYDKGHEVLILEDVGDKLFFDEVCDADDEKKYSLYKKAIELLCQIKTDAKKDPGCIVFNRSFDKTLLNWEFDHFLKYGVEARWDRTVPDEVKRNFKEVTRAVSREITAMDYVFTHRDYQSRNLMLHNSKIYILDFQDALMGPEAYDLVSLTRDSYVEISDSLLERLIDYYCEKRGLDKDGFKEAFNLVTIQRKLKDAGRFVYIDRVKGNPNYLMHIPRSLKYVGKALKRISGYSELYEILKPYVPEWENEI